MADFWKGFADTFDLNPAAGILARSILRNKEDAERGKEEAEKKKKEEAERQAEKQAIIQANEQGIDKLLNGNLSPLQSIMIQGGLSPDYRSAYREYRDSLKPKKQEIFTDSNGNKYPYKQVGNELVPDLENPISVKNQSKYLRTIFDPNTDSYYDLHGYVKDGKEVIEDRQNAGKRKDPKGNELSDDARKIFGDYYQRQQELLAKTNLPKANGYFIDPKSGKEISADVLNMQLKNHNKVYSELVKQSLSKEGLEWYRNLYNTEAKDEFGKIVKKAGENPSGIDYLNNLKESFKEGKLKLEDFQLLVELFKATYGVDPKLINNVQLKMSN